MLKYPCLVLDHDDTVVASEIAVNYPCFLEALEKFRPGEWMDHPEFVSWCFKYEFTDFLRIRYGFTPEEGKEEYEMWKVYARTHIPPVCEGIRDIILEQKVNENDNTFYVYYRNQQQAENQLTIFEKLSIPADWTNEEMQNMHGLQIDITAYAIQADGFTDVEQAFEAGQFE